MDFGGKNIIIGIISILVFLLKGCDPAFDVNIDSGIRKKLQFNCVTIDLYGRSLGKREFVIVQKYSIEKGEAVIYKDSLQIEYNGKRIPYNIEKNNEPLESGSIFLEDNTELWLRFYIPGGIEIGDTITIYPAGFLYCNDSRIDVNTIHLSISE